MKAVLKIVISFFQREWFLLVVLSVIALLVVLFEGIK